MHFHHLRHAFAGLMLAQRSADLGTVSALLEPLQREPLALRLMPGWHPRSSARPATASPGFWRVPARRDDMAEEGQT